jgi:hypothetical membrane protein
MTDMRGRLACGVAGGLLFPVVFLSNDHVKAGYDPVRDSVSEAAIGPGGWVQIANFVITGGLMVVFSTGLRVVVSRWTGRLVAVFGISLVLAGVFVSDSRPDGTRTGHGNMHEIVSLVVFSALAAASFTAARWRPARWRPARWQPTRWWRWYCRATGVAVPVLFLAAGAVSAGGGVLQRLTIIVGWTWLIIVARRAIKAGQNAERKANKRSNEGQQKAEPKPEAALNDRGEGG